MINARKKAREAADAILNLVAGHHRLATKPLDHVHAPPVGWPHAIGPSAEELKAAFMRLAHHYPSEVPRFYGIDYAKDIPRCRICHEPLEAGHIEAPHLGGRVDWLCIPAKLRDGMAEPLVAWLLYGDAKRRISTPATYSESPKASELRTATHENTNSQHSTKETSP